MLDRRLPPKWDGRTIQWGEWSQMPRSLCGKLPNGCEVCGTPAQPQTILGQVQGCKLLLCLLRCGNCGYTTVFDGKLFWELDEDDYGPEGSYTQ